MKAIEPKDWTRIERLMNLNNKETFWEDVKKLTKQVYSSHSINRWQCLAEQRFEEL